MSAVYKKELRSYFTTVYAFIFVALIAATAGIFFTLFNLLGGVSQFESSMFYVCLIFIITVPILTMRSYSEERSRKTEGLLCSLPLSVKDIVLGKFFALLTVFAIPVVMISFLPLILSLFGKVNLAIAYTSILGFILLGCALLSLGLFISSACKSQVVSAIISFVVLLVFFLLDLFGSALEVILPTNAFPNVIMFTILAIAAGALAWLFSKNLLIGMLTAIAVEIPVAALGIIGNVTNNSYMVNGFSHFLSKLSLFGSLSAFLNGLFDLSAVVYFLGVTAIALVLTVRCVDQRRWN